MTLIDELVSNQAAIGYEFLRRDFWRSPNTSLTLRSTRTPPALPSVLSHLPASSAPLIASVQAVPVSFLR